MRLNRRFLTRILFALYRTAGRCGVHAPPSTTIFQYRMYSASNHARWIWTRPYDLPGVSVNLEKQAANLRSICLPYRREWVRSAVYNQPVATRFGPQFGHIAAQLLYGLIRHFKAHCILGGGKGASTYSALRARKDNAAQDAPRPRITYIQPYPTKALQELADVHLIQKRVQSFPRGTFTHPGSNDPLLMDSPPTVSSGSDASCVIREVLEQLRDGAIVRFYDIPPLHDYERDVCQTFLHWSEMPLLHGNLMCNHSIAIIACLSRLHYAPADVLHDVLTEHDPQNYKDGVPINVGKPFKVLPGYFPSSL